MRALYFWYTSLTAKQCWVKMYARILFWKALNGSYDCYTSREDLFSKYVWKD